MSERPGFFTRLFRRSPKVPKPDVVEDLRRAWRDILKHARSPDVEALATRHGYSHPHKFAKRARDVLERQLVEADHRDFSASSIAKLRSAAEAFGIPESKYRPLILSATQRALAEKCRWAMRDHQLTDDELAAVEGYAGSLGIAPSAARDMLTAEADRIFRAVIDRALADDALSPDEHAMIERMPDALRFCSPLPHSLSQRLDVARTYWAIQYGELPVVEPSLLMQRGEACHAEVTAEATETREETVRVKYAGASLRIPIMKGLSYRSASYSVGRDTRAYTHSFGRGILCITSKRLIFSGPGRGITVPYTKVVSATSFDDAIEVHRATGKPIRFLLGRDAQFAGAIFARAVQDSVR